MRPDDREEFLVRYLPELATTDYLDLFADFRNGGYRILGDLVCDIDDENRMMERKQLLRETDSAQFCTMMTAYVEKPFAQDYRKKVVQFQIPIFSENTKGAWTIRFDDVIADALELGPLRQSEVEFSEELLERIDAVMPYGVPQNIVTTLIAYYAVNRRSDTDWVVLPVANFDAYFGSTMFSRKYMGKLPKEIIERSEHGFGVSRYRI